VLLDELQAQRTPPSGRRNRGVQNHKPGASTSVVETLWLSLRPVRWACRLVAEELAGLTIVNDIESDLLALSKTRIHARRVDRADMDKDSLAACRPALMKPKPFLPN